MQSFLLEGELKRVVTAARTNNQIHGASNIPEQRTPLLRSTAAC